MSTTWDPAAYLTFDDHRARPFHDLLARVTARSPRRVVDLGCGPGHLTALLAAQLLDEAGFPPELWQVVAGPGPEVGGAIVAHADYVCFTGSTATGRKIAQGCADRLIGCSLELGGKNPLLVLRDADLEKAAEGAVRAAFSIRRSSRMTSSTARPTAAETGLPPNVLK